MARAPRRSEAAASYLRAQGSVLAASRRAELADQVLAVIDSPEMSALFGPGSRGEVPFSGVLNRPGKPPLALSGRLDRLAVTDDALHIADFKLLAARPDLATRPLRPEFEDFPFRDDEPAFRAWARGRTGYPLVDAGMRQLWRTGYMHNRVRMIVASFLIKHLLIDWRRGEAWFWDTLIDADPANNPASWQWVAGSGADAAPYFRIFNPVLQGETFDPDGAYVRRWVPELQRLEARFVHAPWLAPADALARAGLTLGRTYPSPIVDHAAARARALAAFATIRRR